MIIKYNNNEKKENINNSDKESYSNDNNEKKENINNNNNNTYKFSISTYLSNKNKYINTNINKSQYAILQYKYPGLLNMIDNYTIKNIIDNTTLYNYLIMINKIKNNIYIHNLNKLLIFELYNNIIRDAYLFNPNDLEQPLNSLQRKILKNTYPTIKYNKYLPKFIVKEILLKHAKKNKTCITIKCFCFNNTNKFLYTEEKINKLWIKIEKYNNNNNSTNIK